MKFLIVGDPHGVIPKIPKNIEFDAILCPGDFCDDIHIRKYLKQAAKKQMYWRDICTPNQLKVLEKHLIRSGQKVLTALGKIKAPVYVVPGNWDAISLGKETIWEQYKIPKNVISVDMKKQELTDVSLVGYGKNGFTELPMYDVGEYTKTQLKQCIQSYVSTYRKLDRVIQKTKKPIVMLVHNPPYQSGFDLVKQNTSMKGKYVGSLIARQILIEHKPLAIISGHMHEYFACKEIKKTFLISSGYKRTRFLYDTKRKTITKV